jgi:hypothetical protein
MTSTDAARIQVIPIIVSVPLDQAATLIAHIEAVSSGDVSFSLINQRRRLGSRKSDAVLQLAVSFVVGVGSSIVATAIVELFAHPGVTAVNNQITIGSVNVNLDQSRVNERLIEHLNEIEATQAPAIVHPPRKKSEVKPKSPCGSDK